MATGELLSEVDGGPLANETRSIFAHIERGLQSHPHSPAVICMHQPSYHLANLVAVDEKLQHEDGFRDCLVLTYSQLHQVALRLCAGLLAKGLKPGSTVLIAIENGAEWAILIWCCAILRLTCAALAPSLLDESRRLEQRRYLSALRPSVVIVDDMAKAEVLDCALQGLDLERPLCISLTGVKTDGRTLTLREMIIGIHPGGYDEEALLLDARKDDPERIHSVLFTSGTSAGEPKGCPLRVAGVTHILESQAWLLNPENCGLVLQQAHNARAIAERHLLQTWQVGGAVVLSTGQSFAIAHTIEAIVKYHVTFLVLSPSMVHALAQRLANDPSSRDCVKSVQVGGDAVTKEVLTKCAALFPNAKAFINHGMSEGGGFFQWPFFQTAIREIPCVGGLCPTGRVAAGARVRIGNEQGKLVRRGEAGQLHVCCGSIIPYYLGGVDAASFLQDGDTCWFDTGDIATMDSEGVVCILGRAKDAVKRDGKVMVTARLESCIETYAGIQVRLSQATRRKRRWADPLG